MRILLWRISLAVGTPQERDSRACNPNRQRDMQCKGRVPLLIGRCCFDPPFFMHVHPASCVDFGVVVFRVALWRCDFESLINYTSEKKGVEVATLAHARRYKGTPLLNEQELLVEVDREEACQS